MSCPIAVGLLGTPIVSQLKYSLPGKGGFPLVQRIFRRIICQKVEREFRLLEVPFLDETHAHDVPVKGQRLFGVLDSEHRVIEDVRAGIGVWRHCAGIAESWGCGR